MMKHILKPVIILLLFFAIILLIANPFSQKIDPAVFEKGFCGIIIKIKKTSRNYDHILLLENNKEISIIDRVRYHESYSINIGDSLIKEANSCTFDYKRKEQIIFHIENACKEIFITSQEF